MGADFNGSQWIDSVAAYNRASSDHTVSMWLRVDSTSGTRRPMGNTGAWEARAAGTTLTSDYLQSGSLNTVTLTTGVIHHVVFVQDVTNGDRFGYLDGQVVSTILTATFPGAQNAVLTIAESPGGSGQGWNGVIDNIRVFDRALSAGEIQTMFACRGSDGIVADSLLFHMKEGAEGAVASSFFDQTEPKIDCTVPNGTPVYNYDAGLKFRRHA